MLCMHQESRHNASFARTDSGADEARVEGAGDGDVGGALNDGAAVGEEGEGVGRTLEAEEEIVEADGDRRGARRSRMAAKSMGRWCSWIWTELRPQRVMWGGLRRRDG